MNSTKKGVFPEPSASVMSWMYRNQTTRTVQPNNQKARYRNGSNDCEAGVKCQQMEMFLPVGE